MRHIIGIALATAVAGPAMRGSLCHRATTSSSLQLDRDIWRREWRRGVGSAGPIQYSNEPVRSRFHQFQWWNGRRNGWRTNTARSCRLGLRDGPRLGRHQRFVGSHAIYFRRPGRLHGQRNDQCQLGFDREDTPRICLGQLLVLCDCRLSCAWRQDQLSTLSGLTCGSLGVIGGLPGELKCSGSNKRIGGTLGAGVEYGFTPNWSAKLEYRYTAAASLELSHSTRCWWA